jgi:HAMP domain-containing protein
MKFIGKGNDGDILRRNTLDRWSSSDAAELHDVVRAAAAAVTALADRLNTLALRVALFGGVSEAAASSNVESYLNRLASLVDSAGEQMHRVQKLIRVLETATIQTEAYAHVADGHGDQAK